MLKKVSFSYKLFFLGSFSFLLIVLGCGLKIGEDNLTINSEGVVTGCLKSLDKKMALYIEGQLNKEEIQTTSNCIRGALRLFKNHVRGNTVGEFTPDELRKFIQDLFLKDKVISNSLLEQLMNLKTMIIGGSSDKLTQSDLDQFNIFVKVIMESASVFYPYIKSLHTQDPSTLKLSLQKDLTGSIKKVSQFIKNFSNPYLFSDFKVLIREVNLFMDSNYQNDQLDRQIDLLAELKHFMVGGSKIYIEPEAWEKFFMAYQHVVFAQYHYYFFQKKGGLVSLTDLRSLRQAVNSLIEVLSLAVENRSSKVVLSTDFFSLADQLQKNNILTKALSKESIKRIFHILLGKVFNVDKSRYGITELTLPQLEKIQKIVQIGDGLTSFLDHFKNQPDFQQKVMSRASLKEFFSYDESIINTDIDFFEMILKDIHSFKPFYQKDSLKISISNALFNAGSKGKTNILDDKLAYRKFTIYSLYYLLNLMLRWGYEKEYPEGPGMAEEELSRFFKDFFTIGVDMTWMEKTNNISFSPGEPEFIVANVLTAGAKGFNLDWNKTEYLNSREIVEYISYMFSFGISLEEVEDNLVKICGLGRETGKEKIVIPLEYQLYNISCVRQNLFSVLKKTMTHLPDLQVVLNNMDKQEREEWVSALIHISFESKKAYQSAIVLERRHLKNIVMALYFVETTINRYDLDGNLNLEQEEIMEEAYPVFEGYLYRVVVNSFCYDKPEIIKPLYKYTVKNRALPSLEKGAWYERIFYWSILALDQYGVYSIEDFSLNRSALTLVYSDLVKSFIEKKEIINEKKCEPLKPDLEEKATNLNQEKEDAGTTRYRSRRNLFSPPQ